MQARLQQRPPAQKPERHSPAAEQAAPSSPSGRQRPPWQKLSGAQALLALQPPAQIAPLQVKGAHLTMVGGRQTPVPEQTARACAIPAAQLAGAHSVSPAGYWQLPRSSPSQLPAQGEPAPRQGGRCPRGAPLTGRQLPEVPGRSQASHAPVQLD